MPLTRLQLLTTIEENGEFEAYVERLADREGREKRALRRRDKERQRLAMGDQFVSEDDSLAETEEVESPQESSPDEYDTEDESEASLSVY